MQEQKTVPTPVEDAHTVCTSCAGGCSMKALVRDGRVQSLVPTADYPEDQQQPRGCLKGVNFAGLLDGPQRLTGPMLRKGSDKSWEAFAPASWDEAVGHTAAELRRIADAYGPESIAVVVKDEGGGYVHKGALARLAALEGWSLVGGLDMNGALPLAMPMTFGIAGEEVASAHWERAACVLVFGANLAPSCVPDTYFVAKAKKAGARLLVVDPNFSALAAESDAWYSVKHGSEAAVALGLARVLVEKGLYDGDFVKTCTDLPLLVRCDNGKRLLAADVAGLEAIPSEAGRETYVAYNGWPIAVNPDRLEMPHDVRLEGDVEIPLATGGVVQVKPAFQLLRENLAAYTPEMVEASSDMPAAELLRTAHEIAGAKPLHVILGTACNQNYHGDLAGRAAALLAALTGSIGRVGGGFSTFGGQYRTRLDLTSWWQVEGKKANALPFAYLLHGPTAGMAAAYPKNGIRALIVGWSNPFDQHDVAGRLRAMVEDGTLELVVSLDFQKTTTGRYSHVLLPGVSWFEKTELVSTPVHGRLQLMQPAIEPVGECLPELEITRRLAAALNKGHTGHFMPWRTAEAATEEIIGVLLEQNRPLTDGITLEGLRQGPLPLGGNSPHGHVPFYPQVNGRQPFGGGDATGAPLLKTGRMEFYKDEDTFLREGEALPVYKESFADTECRLQGDADEMFPFAFVTRNNVHRTHSTHCGQLAARSLEDENPRVWLSPEDAAEQGIEAGEMVRLFNRRGGLVAQAVLDSGIHPGLLVYEGAWWSRYTRGTEYNALLYPFIKPTHEVHFVHGVWAPNIAWNECLCDVRRVEGEQGE